MVNCEHEIKVDTLLIVGSKWNCIDISFNRKNTFFKFEPNWSYTTKRNEMSLDQIIIVDKVGIRREAGAYEVLLTMISSNHMFQYSSTYLP